MEQMASLDTLAESYEKSLLDSALQNRHDEAVRSATVLQALYLRQILSMLRPDAHRTSTFRALSHALEGVSKGVELRLRALVPQSRATGKQVTADPEPQVQQ